MFIEVTQIYRDKDADIFDPVEKIKIIVSTRSITRVIYLDATALPAKSEIIFLDDTCVQVEEDYPTLKTWLVK